MNPFKETIYRIGSDGRIFQLHWKNRHTGGELLLLAGGALQATSAIQQGRVAEAQGEFANKVAQRNQQALQRQELAEQQAAKLDEQRISRRQKLVQGAEMAAQGKTNVGLAGASINALADTAFQFSLDRNLRLRQGLIAGQELTDRGNILAAEGRWQETMGKQARQSSYLNAGGSILSSVGMAGLYRGGFGSLKNAGGMKPGKVGFGGGSFGNAGGSDLTFGSYA